MNSSTIHNILINQGAEGLAANLLSLLRRAGISINPREFDGTHLPDDVPGGESHDLILLLADSLGQSCEALLRQLQSSRRDIPCLLICKTPARWLPMLSLGAAGLIGEPQLESAAGQVQFVYQVRRELDQLLQRREMRRAISNARELNQRLQVFMDNTRDAIACLQDGFHQYANPAWLRFFGFPALADTQGISFLDLVAEEDVERVRTFMTGPFQAGHQRCEFTAVRRDGQEVLSTVDSASVSINGMQSLQLIVQIAHGNAALSNAVREAVSRDLQTGLLNEEHLLRSINQAISSAVYQSRFSALLMLSASQLPEIAVVLGKTDMHMFLRDIASVLASRCPLQSVLGRLDSGDFIVLMPDADTESCQHLLQTLDGLNTTLLPLVPAGLSLQFSVGAAMITDEAPDADTLLIRARQHQAIRRHQSGSNQGANQSSATLELLRQALQEENLLLVYQPTVCLRADAREYYEVRVRLPMADRLVYPTEFIDAANQHGMGERLDRYVLTHAMRAIRHHANEQLRLTINLTANSLLSQTLLAWLTQELQRQQQSPRQIVLQVSEVDFLSAPEQARSFCAQVRKLGFELSVTHFGCSLDPFRMLGEVQAEFVKLDRALLQNIDVDARQRERLYEVVSVLHGQGIRVIAPMVEEVELLPILWQANVNFVQGNCLQQPSDHMDFGLFNEEELSQLPAD
ncbi:MAG: EAL domain-containing protein [Pseudohongiella sp.]|nr:EAL domain-containing protein [Pseudohongiella sp.]